MKSRPCHRFSALLLVLLMLAPAAAEAKKKKKRGENDGLLTGTVENHGGELLADVLVTVTGDSAAADSAAGDSVASEREPFRGEATSDKKGEFEILIPEASGSYRVRLSKAGYAPFEAELDFLPGEQKLIDFTLLDEAAGRRQEAADAYNRGAGAFNAGDRGAAKELFRQAAELDPSLAAPLLPLADISLAEGDPQAAAAWAEKFLALEPGDRQAQVIAHEAYRKLGDEAKVEELRQALGGDAELAGQLAVQVFNEGAMAHQEQDYEQAQAKFREALELDPGLTAAHAALAGIAYNRGAYDQALAAATKILELESGNVQGHRYRYLAHDALGETAAAAAALDAYLAVDATGAAELLYQRADLDFRDGKPEVAKAALLEVLEVAPEMARAHYTLGLIYASSDTAAARRHLEKFLQLAPDDPEAPAARDMLSYF